ncbi:MAG TPA: hypothetical protein ENI23_05515 [bacterium]|nr:hypothetical protein [bacterium]
MEDKKLTPVREHTQMVALEQLQSDCHDNALFHGFWDEYNQLREMASKAGRLNLMDAIEHATFAQKLMLTVSELAEAMEADRLGDPLDSHCPEFTSREIELADVLIRVFDYSKFFKLRLGKAVIAKMKFNASRPHMHGKKY